MVRAENDLLDNIHGEAIWTITTGGIVPTGGSYTTRLYVENIIGLSDAADNAFTVVKRPDGSLTYADFGLGSSNQFGCQPELDMPGRIYDNGNGFAERQCFTGFSEFAIATSLGLVPLPVELISFEAELVNDVVILEWQTATEINSSHFIIERSQDLVSWKEISTVSSVGNSTVTQFYSIEDLRSEAGVNYYRLIQVDFDGQTEVFSNIVSVFNDKDGSYSERSYKVYPNPAVDGKVNIELINFKDGEEVDVKIMTSGGYEYLNQVWNVDATGYIKTELDLDFKLPQGAYIINFTTSDEKLNTLLIVE